MTETTRPRANRDGDLCPPWCVTDHDEVHGEAGTYSFHGGEPAAVEIPGAGILEDKIIIRAVHPGNGYAGPAQVSVNGIRYGTGEADPHAWISPREALRVAGLIEMLAKATPARHRDPPGRRAGHGGQPWVRASGIRETAYASACRRTVTVRGSARAGSPAPCGTRTAAPGRACG